MVRFLMGGLSDRFVDGGEGSGEGLVHEVEGDVDVGGVVSAACVELCAEESELVSDEVESGVRRLLQVACGVATIVFFRFCQGRDRGFRGRGAGEEATLIEEGFCAFGQAFALTVL